MKDLYLQKQLVLVKASYVITTKNLELMCRMSKECDLGDIFSLLGMKSYERAWYNPCIVNRIVGFVTPDCIKRIGIPSLPDDKNS